MSGIYLHIPFCKQACSYCDFYFVTRDAERDSFVNRLIAEIESYRHSDYTKQTVSTIYFGGGTPSLLEPHQVEAILLKLDDIFCLDTSEITFEMNPDDVSAELLESLKKTGISRASMGVQSFQPELLNFMNRSHSREEALKSLDLLSKSNFQSFTIDLIYGNPGQTLSQLEDDLNTLLRFHPPHLSAYSLTIESNTRLGKQLSLGKIIPADNDKVADHFEMINRRLQLQGIERYEVSNYCRPGWEAIHNRNYWQHVNYLGFGPGAHSFWWDEKATRWKNKSDLRSYLKTKNVTENCETLSLQQLAEERLMMGLRTREGVSVNGLAEIYDYHLSNHQKKYLQKCQNQDKAAKSPRIMLTDKGIAIADAIILDLVTLH